MTVFPQKRLLACLCALPLCAALGCGGSKDKPNPKPPDPDTCTAEQDAECAAQGKVCIGYTGSCEFAEKTVLKLAAADGATTFSDGAGKGLDISLTLNNPPSKLVTVQLSTEDAKAKITPSEISFHTDDWQRAQKVTIVGTDDDDVNDGRRKITLKAVSASEDAEFNNLSASLELTHLDALDETAECGYTETLSGGALEIAESKKAWFEGETGTYCVSLKKQPSADVDLVFNKTDVLSFTGDNSDNGNGHLVFTPENFSNQQCLSFKVADTDNAWNGGGTVSAESNQDLLTRNNLPEEHALYRNDEVQVPLYYRGGDGITDGLFTVAATVTTEDECYSAEGVKASLRATVLDQNGPWLILPTDFDTALTEGDTEYKLYTVKLAGQPTGNVSVIATDSTNSIEFSSGGSTTSIALTPEKWNTGATFQLRAKNNDAANSASEVPVKFSVTSVDDAGYAGLKNLNVAQETFQIADDDTCNISLRETSGRAYWKPETVFLYVKLTAKPDTSAATFDVNLALSDDKTGATLSKQTVTFDLTNASADNYYSKEQRVNLTLSGLDWGDVNKAVGSITVTASADGLDDVTLSKDRLLLAAQTFTYKNSAQVTALPVGTYDIQAWGASSEASATDSATAGGSTTSNEYLMGWGAYASGRLTVATKDTAWIRVGGVANGCHGGYNGGGNGGCEDGGLGGGGASDMCVGNPQKCTNDDEHFPYRILVAAGGGARKGSLAGGNGCTQANQAICVGEGAVTINNVYARSEFFGKGMDAEWTDGAGGGGGWYGGLTASNDSPEDPYGAFFVDLGKAGGSGGSSFCFKGVNPANYTNNEYKEGKLTDDTYKLSNCQTLAGGNWATESDAKLYYVGDTKQNLLPTQNPVYGRRGNGLVIITPVYK